MSSTSKLWLGTVTSEMKWNELLDPNYVLNKYFNKPHSASQKTQKANSFLSLSSSTTSPRKPKSHPTLPKKLSLSSSWKLAYDTRKKSESLLSDKSTKSAKSQTKRQPSKTLNKPQKVTRPEPIDFSKIIIVDAQQMPHNVFNKPPAEGQNLAQDIVQAHRMQACAQVRDRYKASQLGTSQPFRLKGQGSRMSSGVPLCSPPTEIMGMGKQYTQRMRYNRSLSQKQQQHLAQNAQLQQYYNQQYAQQMQQWQQWQQWQQYNYWMDQQGLQYQQVPMIQAYTVPNPPKKLKKGRRLCGNSYYK